MSEAHQPSDRWATRFSVQNLSTDQDALALVCGQRLPIQRTSIAEALCECPVVQVRRYASVYWAQVRLHSAGRLSQPDEFLTARFPRCAADSDVVALTLAAANCVGLVRAKGDGDYGDLCP